MDSKFLVVPWKSIYNLILKRPSTVELDIVASSVRLKLKLYNLHGEPVTINDDLEGAKRIYQELRQDQGKYKAIENNMSSLAGQLRSMNIRSPSHKKNKSCRPNRRERLTRKLHTKENK